MRGWRFEMSLVLRPNNGLFVVLEGGDYTGKGTQAIRLAEHILDLSEDNDVVITHEPTRRALEIKRKLKEEDAYVDAERMAELYVEDRVRHSRDFIRPNLEQGAIVIGNRYHLSTLVYQSIQGVSLTKLIDMHIRPEIVTPDLTILLDISPETADKRAENRRESPERKFEQRNFRNFVYQRYLEIALSDRYQEVFGNVEIVDGNESVEEVAKSVRGVFNLRYENWLEN